MLFIARMEVSKQYDLLFRLVLLGSSYVGKTALVQCYITGAYSRITYATCGKSGCHLQHVYTGVHVMLRL